MRTLVLVLGLSLLPAAALGAPLRIQNGRPVRIAIAGHRQPGVGLKARGGAWRVELGATRAVRAAVEDVTDGAPKHDKWTVEVSGGALTLTAPRFLPGHAYRVELAPGQDAYVYLYPPARGRAADQHLAFSDGDASPAPAGEVTEDGIAITPKGEL